MHVLGALSLLAAVVLSLMGAVNIFTAPPDFWTGQGQEVLVSSYLAGSLMAGFFGVCLIGIGLPMARPRQLSRPVAVLGVIYCLTWLSESIFLAVKGNSWLTGAADVVTLVICFLPGLVAIMESQVMRRPRRSGSGAS